MKVDKDQHSSEEQVKDKFKIMQVQAPKLVCPNNKSAMFLCANELCENSSYFCSSPDCQDCSQHRYCTFVPIARVTNSINSKLHYLSEIKLDLWKINQGMIDQLQKDLTAFCEENIKKMMPLDFQAMIHTIYEEKKSQLITGKQVIQLCSYLDGKVDEDLREYFFIQYKKSVDELKGKLFKFKEDFVQNIYQQEEKYMTLKKQMEKQLWKIKAQLKLKGQTIDQLFFKNLSPPLKQLATIIGKEEFLKNQIFKLVSEETRIKNQEASRRQNSLFGNTSEASRRQNSLFGNTSLFGQTNNQPFVIQKTSKYINLTYQEIQIDLEIYQKINQSSQQIFGASNNSYNINFTILDKCNFLIFVYNANQSTSFFEFQSNKDWNQIIEKYRWKIPMLLLGNKTNNQPRYVKYNDAKYFAMKNGMTLYQVSVKENSQQLEQIFTDFIGKNSVHGQRVFKWYQQLPMEDVYMFFLLHLLEDFQEDLLQDAIDLLLQQE